MHWVSLARLALELPRGQGMAGAFAGAGSASQNDIRLDLQSLIKGNSNHCGQQWQWHNAGNVTISATDRSNIEAEAVGVAIAVGGGSGMCGSRLPSALVWPLTTSTMMC